MKRMLIGGLVGGLAVYIWSFISHMVLPIGSAGISIIQQNEDVVLETMKTNISEPGLYFIPGIDPNTDMSSEAYKTWEEKYKTGPRGLLLFNPEGADPMSIGQLLTELLTNLIAGIIAAFLLFSLIGSYWIRVYTVTLLGLFSWISISASYWNWYGFPGSFIVAEGIDQVIGWFLAGIVMAKIVKVKAL